MSFEEISLCPENFISEPQIFQGFPSHRNTIFLTMQTLGENIYSIRKAVSRPQAGGNRRGRGRLVD
jgi:hypothetical protein